MAVAQNQLVARPNAKPKHDNIDWEALEAFPGPFNLEFRIPVDTARETSRIIRYSVFVVVIVLGVSLLPLPVFLLLCSPEIGGGILLIGLMCMVTDYLRSEESERLDLMRRSYLKALIPFGLWCGVLCVHMLRDRLSGVVVFAATPFFLFFLADRIAKHALWQKTAHPRLSISTMIKWRKALDRRIDFMNPVDAPPQRLDLTEAEEKRHARVLRTIRSRIELIATCMIATGLAFIPFAGLFTFKVLSPVQAASCLGIAFVPSFVGTAWLMDRGNFKGNVRETWAAVLSYFGHLRDVRVPGWCAISPVGDQKWRQTLWLVAVALVTSVIATCTEYSMVFTMCRGPWDNIAAQIPGMAETQATQFFERRLGWPILLWLGIVDGQPFFVLALIMSVILCVVVPLVTLFFALVIAIGPLLGEVHDALENPKTAYEQEQNVWSDWDGYGRRLCESPNPWERRCILLGIDARFGFPLLLDYELVWEGIQVIGSTGSGKTQLSLLNLLIQLIRRRAYDIPTRSKRE